MKISVDKYDHEKHMKLVASWYFKYDILPVPEKWLSTSGYVVNIDETPVAALWLYLTDSKICYLEHLISDKDIEKESKRFAILVLGKYIMEDAKNLGYDLMLSMSINEGAMSMILDIGFKESSGFKVFARSLQ